MSIFYTNWHISGLWAGNLVNPLCSTVGVTLLHSNTAECLPYEVNQPAKLSCVKIGSLKKRHRKESEGGGRWCHGAPTIWWSRHHYTNAICQEWGKCGFSCFSEAEFSVTGWSGRGPRGQVAEVEDRRESMILKRTVETAGSSQFWFLKLSMVRIPKSGGNP